MITIDSEFKALIPPLSKEEYAGLKESLINEGCRDPLVVWNDTIIDGHNRYEICSERGISYNTIGKQFADRDEVKIWVIQNQFSRRNLSPYSRSELALLLEPLISAKAKENQKSAGGAVPQKSAEAVETRKEIAKIAGVSHDTITKVKKIKAEATDEAKKKLRDGEISINEAHKTLKKAEKEKQKQTAIETLNSEISKPNGLYHVLVIDPPWRYEKRAEDASHRGRCLYPTMSIEELKEIAIPAEENAVLWLWTTNAFMHDAYHLLETWEFEPKTILTWVKDRMGTGDWLRGKTEHCILAVKGKPVINLTNQTTALNAPLREHSRKPDQFYDMVSEMCPGRKVDLFSREPREGWDQWGCEVDKF